MENLDDELARHLAALKQVQQRMPDTPDSAPPPAPGVWVPTIRKLAERVDVDAADMSRFLKAHAIRKCRTGYNATEIERMYREEHPKREDREEIRKSDPRWRKAAIEADRAELKLKYERGELVKLADVVAFVSRFGNKVNDELQKLFNEFRNTGAEMSPDQFDEWSRNRLNVFNALLRDWYERYDAGDALSP